MARKAREKIPYGTYEIFCESRKELDALESEQDRLKLIEILDDARRKLDFSIYLIDLVEDNRIRLIIYDNGSDISKIMKSISINYAIYKSADKKLFKDRYKSNLILNPYDLEALLTNDYNERKNDAWYYSSIMDQAKYVDKKIVFGIPKSNVSSVCKHVNPNDCNQSICIRTYDAGYDYLVENVVKDYKSIEDFLSDKNARNEQIKFLRKHSTLSMKDIGKLFGNLSESTICKILNN